MQDHALTSQTLMELRAEAQCKAAKAPVIQNNNKNLKSCNFLCRRDSSVGYCPASERNASAASSVLSEAEQNQHPVYFCIHLVTGAHWENLILC